MGGYIIKRRVLKLELIQYVGCRSLNVHDTVIKFNMNGLGGKHATSNLKEWQLGDDH